jgi:squalene-associated FAD-dependent desaturase
MPTAIVAGGGLAGITAACDLADAGYRVTLIEKRPFLGGRSYSYTDKETGATVDNGQHVFLGCCTEYIALLKRLGAWDKAHLQKRLRVPVVDKVRGTSLLAATDLPPPLHLLPSLLRFKSLSPTEKAAAGWALAHIQNLDRSKHPELDAVTFAEWLREKRQSANAIRGFWNLVTLPTLNGDISEVNADLALMVFQEGFLRSRTGANVGWSKVGLSELVGDAARRYIESRGGEVRLGETVRGVGLDGGATPGVLTDSGLVEADGVVLALDPQALAEVLPDSVAHDPFFGRINRLQPSPIVNLHFWYSGEAAWDRPFAAFLNTPVQWVFNKTMLSRPPTVVGAQHAAAAPRTLHLDVSLSGATQWVDIPNADLVTLFSKELWSLIPGLRGATLDRALVVKQRNATFAARPGVAALRPSQRTPVPGLYLVGDYTDTGWPATMESAVRSGRMAARDVVTDIGVRIHEEEQLSRLRR